MCLFTLLIISALLESDCVSYWFLKVVVSSVLVSSLFASIVINISVVMIEYVCVMVNSFSLWVLLLFGIL